MKLFKHLKKWKKVEPKKEFELRSMSACYLSFALILYLIGFFVFMCGIDNTCPFHSNQILVAGVASLLGFGLIFIMGFLFQLALIRKKIERLLGEKINYD